MKNYSLSHLTDGALLSGLSAIVASDRATTAELLAHIAEVDARKLYVPAAHPSMHSYCVHELHLSEHAALKRIRAARAARNCPALYTALTEGRLNLCSLVMLAPRITPENAEELITAAIHKTRPEIERMLAERFPSSDVPAAIAAIPMQPGLATGELATGRVEMSAGQLATWRVEDASPPQIAPLAPERFALKLTIGQEAHDELRYAQSLLGKLSTGDLPEVFARAIHELVAKLEKQKFAKTNRPRKNSRLSSENPQHIPARVKRAVVERDQGRCTFVSEAGNRCPCTSRIEFDHILEVARGGESSIANLRLRCRAHNQYAAEQAFGMEFMANKRQEARVTGTKARDLAAARAGVGSEDPARAMASEDADVFGAEVAYASGRAREEVVAAAAVDEVRAGEPSRAESVAAAEGAGAMDRPRREIAGERVRLIQQSAQRS